MKLRVRQALRPTVAAKTTSDLLCLVASAPAGAGGTPALRWVQSRSSPRCASKISRSSLAATLPRSDPATRIGSTIKSGADRLNARQARRL